MSWPPTDIDMLMNLDGASETWSSGPMHFFAGPGKGVAFYDPKYVKRLIDDELAVQIEFKPGGWHGWAYHLTDKGKEAVAMLKGEIQASRFRQPNWVLAALTEKDHAP